MLRTSGRTDRVALLVGLAMFVHFSVAAGLVPLSAYLERRRNRPTRDRGVVMLEDTPRRRAVTPPPPPVAPPPEPARAAHQVRPAETQPERQRPAPTRAAPVMVVQGEQSNDDPSDEVPVGDNLHATGDVSSDGVVRSQGVTGAVRGGAETAPGPAIVAPPPRPATPPPTDFSTHATLDCDEDAARDNFPEAAREAGIFEQVVRVRVTIDGSGHITGITPVNDPGYGFAAAAMQVVRRFCRTNVGRDRGGANVVDTIPYRVTFVAE